MTAQIISVEDLNGTVVVLDEECMFKVDLIQKRVPNVKTPEQVISFVITDFYSLIVSGKRISLRGVK